MPSSSEFIQTCEALSVLEREMGTFIHWIAAENKLHGSHDKLGDIIARCKAVQKSIHYHRKSILAISSSISFKWSGHDEYDVDYRFGSKSVESRSDHLNEQIIGVAESKFNAFIFDIGNSSNGKEDRWDIKGIAVHNLETFMREELALDKSFSFLSNKLFGGETTMRLSTHKIWWEKHDAEDFEQMPWTKLLKSGTGYEYNLGVISKDRRMLKWLLNELVTKGLYTPLCGVTTS